MKNLNSFNKIISTPSLENYRKFRFTIKELDILIISIYNMSRLLEMKIIDGAKHMPEHSNTLNNLKESFNESTSKFSSDVIKMAIISKSVTTLPSDQEKLSEEVKRRVKEYQEECIGIEIAFNRLRIPEEKKAA